MMWNWGFIVFTCKASACTHNEFYVLEKVVKKATLRLSNILMRLVLPAPSPSVILVVLLRHRCLFRTRMHKEECVVLLCVSQNGAFSALKCKQNTPGELYDKSDSSRAPRRDTRRSSASIYTIRATFYEHFLKGFKTFLHTSLENVTYFEPEAGWHLLWVRIKRGLY